MATYKGWHYMVAITIAYRKLPCILFIYRLYVFLRRTGHRHNYEETTD